MRTTTRPRRRALTTFLVLLTALAVTGCTRGAMNLTVNPDDTVSGSIVFAVGENMLNVEEGQTVDEALDAYFEGLQGDPTADVPGGEITDYAADGYVGRQVDIENVGFDELAERFSEYDLLITHSGGNHRFDMTVDLTDHPQMDDDVREGMDLTVQVTLPGRISDTNGEATDDGSVRWVLDGTKVNELYAVSVPAPAEEESDGASEAADSEAAGATGSTWLIWLFAAVAVAIAVLVTVILLDRRRARLAGPPTPPPTGSDIGDTQEIPVFRDGHASPTDRPSPPPDSPFRT